MPRQNPASKRRGTNQYLVDATSLFDAVRRALAINEERLGRRPDDTFVTVIEDGKQSIYWDYQEHNATKRQWRVRVGRVKTKRDHVILIMFTHRSHLDELSVSRKVGPEIRRTNSKWRDRRNRSTCPGKMTNTEGAAQLFSSPSRLSEEDDEAPNTNFHGIVAVRVSQPDRAGKSGRTCEPNTDLELS